MQVRKQQLELDMEQQIGSKSDKECVKAVYCHPAYLTSMHQFLCRVHNEKSWAGRSTSWNQDCGRNINNLRYADDTTLTAESEEELKSLLRKVKEENEKVGLKLNIQKKKIQKTKMGIRSHHFMANRWGNGGNSVRLYLFEFENHCGR